VILKEGGSQRAGGADPVQARYQPGHVRRLAKARYGGANVEELKRLKELKAENVKLNRMYADLSMENAAIKDGLSRRL